MIGPSQGSIWPGKCGVNVELRVRVRKRHAAERRIVREVSEGFNLSDGKLGRRMGRGPTLAIVGGERDEAFSKRGRVELAGSHRFTPSGRDRFG